MIVDTSALVALVLREPGYEAIQGKLEEAPAPLIGGPTLTEPGIVLSPRLDRDARALIARLVQDAGIEVVPFTDVHASAAVDAWLRFGKGRHPAALNFGDCCTYALAHLSGQPLLCTGDGFPQTDLRLA